MTTHAQRGQALVLGLALLLAGSVALALLAGAGRATATKHRLVNAADAAALFYGRLFEIAPEVKPLFKGEITEQGRKLMATLAVVVNGLDNLPSILPAASALAKKHVGYGVAAEHYAPVGAALLWTLIRKSV